MAPAHRMVTKSLASEADNVVLHDLASLQVESILGRA